MKVHLSIKEYVNWTCKRTDDVDQLKWTTKAFIEGWKGIKEEYKHLSDIPAECLPSFLFVDQEEFRKAVKLCGSDDPELELDPIGGSDIEIE